LDLANVILYGYKASKLCEVDPLLKILNEHQKHIRDSAIARKVASVFLQHPHYTPFVDQANSWTSFADRLEQSEAPIAALQVRQRANSDGV
jgi:hypothetical protein